ncbi:delta(24)-sterol C-methyltransferase [Aspergillus tubingensis]|uniref:SAM-dependent methyltransferase Erg6/SMT-type domain-containing protein n=2 Tax=Aspergillus subgen. Circumdati TaxID=2720871 RepID=A0A100IP76_ASPNG|nr:sterol 24-C-methyltransferase [Aspergillus tubingensis]GAQ44832.1 hypothetical protein ASPNIDRAFT_42246 [Aspergillus niger]GFN11774.1 sterol 24-C-methyltransferase [Aspergillus tubingensis]GLA66627.1 delta(24)-sterol C-methyltransferase [Aspergillus tubingensis]GLA74274.1 delta(24)-sterol C-methyltransferase [Aspergillus tubingensis]GLA85091.1 delta(24)-sterol C-methyltransferase [Aspergillus tubingensis]
MAPGSHYQNKQDAILTKQLHGTTGKAQGLLAMRKDFKTHKAVLDGYFEYFGRNVVEEDREETASGIHNYGKAGAVFGVYEWLLTDKYEEENTEHRQLALGIQQGNGIAKLFTISEGLDAMKSAGFEILHHEDFAHRPCTAPWYYPLDISLWNARHYGDLFYYALMSKWGRTATHYMLRGLETVRAVPKGTTAVEDSLDLAGDSLVEAGKKDIFTPMYLMLGRKPDA